MVTISSISYFVQTATAETDSLSEQIRHGKLRPMLDLGVTPSQVSLQASKDQARTYFSGVEDDIDGGSQAYCLPLQSLGLGGNRISCRGAAYLADGLRTNTSKWLDHLVLHTQNYIYIAHFNDFNWPILNKVH